MNRALIYFFAGTAVSFLINHFLLAGNSWQAELYGSSAFGLGWALAYLVDRPEWPLPKKLGFSFAGMLAVTIIGTALFNFETAVPAVIRFSLVFVAYYLLASFKSSKSLRK